MTESQPLVSIDIVLAAARGRAAHYNRQLDPTMSWTAATMADNLADVDEQVYTWNGIGLVYLITPEVADKLGAFIDDFTTPIA